MLPKFLSYIFFVNISGRKARSLSRVNQLPRLSGRWVPGIPRVSTVASQSLDRKLPPWLANPHNPAMGPHSRHPSHWRNSGRKKIGMGGGEDANWTAPQTTAQTLDEELAGPSCVQSYHKPCEPALYRIDRWKPAKLVGCLTAELVDRLTA